MPIKIPQGLPAKEILDSEKIFAIDSERATTQDIRPLKLVILNLMPKKIETETQLLRLISKSPLQVDIDFMKVDSHTSKNTSADHLYKFYDTFSALSTNYYDGMIITGAPLEHLAFEEVDYWNEFKDILEWSKTHVFSTMHICWGAQAALYHHYGIDKRMEDKKIFGIYPHVLCDEFSFLTNGFDEVHNTPQSRHTGIDEDALRASASLDVLSYSSNAGTNIAATKDYRHIFVLGHFEYGRDTLAQEYRRDKAAGASIALPVGYYPHDDEEQTPLFTWRAHANLLYRNWLHYVYQITPFNVEDIALIKEVKKKC